MKMPQELEVWYIIPAIRREFAKAMVKQGLTQKEVAKKLGVTEAAVSQYIKSKRGKEITLTKKVKDSIEESARKVVNNKSSLLNELNKITTLIKKELILCKICHKHLVVEDTCKVCL